MSTSHASGAAHPVTAVAGPPLSPDGERLQALDDAVCAAQVVAQVRAKLERAATDAERADARQALADAEQDAAAARDKVNRLGEGG